MKGRGVLSRLGVVGLVMVLLLSPMAVWADVVADGDKVELNASYPALNLGTVCVGSNASGELDLYVKRNGSYGSTNVFAQGTAVTWSVYSVSGDGLGASISPSSITLPSNWSTVDNNTLSDGVTADITFTPTSAGTFSGQITFRATGTSSRDGNGLTRDGTLLVAANVEVCAPADTTPPTTTAAATANGAPYTFGTWTKYDVVVTLSAADNEGGSGVASTEYKLNDGAWTTYTGPFTVNAEGVTKVSFFSTDVAGNDEDTQVVEVWIDKTPPTFDACPAGGPFILGSGMQSVGPIIVSDATSGVDESGSTLTSQVDTSSVGIKTVTFTAVDNAGNSASKTCDYSVIYDWDGFFRPVDNLPTVNVVKAGQAIPVKFSLSGDQGLSIFDTGYPRAVPIACPDSSSPVGEIAETTTAGNSSLSYDSDVDQYVYVWKTDKSWAGTCRELQVKLIDGETYVANFQFKK